ncbi:MAG TPA: recombinase family protein [Candidatus Competibacteraceae bacterium]|nr:recombinase family protein [Candidatus Competibacteraceae bacterium]
MMMPPASIPSTKITAEHLARKAIVYIRQSSLKQVRENRGSQFTQRALVERAQSLGWHPDRIEVLDGDLGQSATATAGRDAFKALAADVALDHVGIVLGWDASRLARNNADWYQLLDVAALFGTLIADAEGVYDPRVYNDRLLLGLQGTLSEAELHLLRQRLTAGRLSKVQRGEYVQQLPTGLVRLPDQRVQKDPDAQVRQAIELVFAQFEALGSCQKVLRYFKRHGLQLPRRQSSGAHRGEVLWKPPSAAAIYEILSNPAYAGAFVYGRRPTDPSRRQPGRHATGVVRRRVHEWPYLLQNAYPAYISWTQYLANQRRMSDNASRQNGHCFPGRGAPRAGAALLQGLATCGHCGHVMKVAYKPGVRYLCNGLSKEFAEPTCAHLDGPSVEAFVVAAFFEALQPAQLDALEAVLAQRQREQERLAHYYRQQVQRAQYQASLARRRYEQVDPANRLVAAELERDWEEHLRAFREAQETADRFAQQPAQPTLTAELRQQLLHISQTLPQLWSDGALSSVQRKDLLRSLIARVILTRVAPDRVQVKIVWVSGHFSEGVVIPPIHRQAELTGYDQLLLRIHELWQAGCTDTQIAHTLSAQGVRSARNPHLSATTVLNIRNQQHWLSRYHQYRRATKIEGRWTVQGLAKELGVDRNWLYRRLASGRLSPPEAIRWPPYGNYLIQDDPALIERLHREAQPMRRAPRQSHI